MAIRKINDYSQLGKLLLYYKDTVIEILVDECDKDLLKQYQWCWSSDTKGYFNVRCSKIRKCLHQILNPNWKMTDHINRDTKDNRRCNLRETTKFLNRLNCKQRCDNISSFTGVHLHMYLGWSCWQAIWCENKKQKSKNFPYTEEGFKQAIEYRKQMVSLYYPLSPS